MPYRGACHCGAVTFEVDDSPKWLVTCTCSVCRRTGALWFHTAPDRVTVSGETDGYVWGDEMLSFRRCKTCGCLTHYTPLDGAERMAVNMRMADPSEIAGIRVRQFDGADSWAFLD